MDFDQAADELYSVVPSDFVAARKALAAAADDPVLVKRIIALRRPTVSAWAVNLLARGEGLTELLETGRGLRAAVASGEPPGPWAARRSAAVAAAGREAARLAEAHGQPLSPAARREVEETLEAAVVDADIAEEVARGRLIRPRPFSGFGTAAPSPAAPQADTPRPRARKEDPRLKQRRLEVAAEEAEEAAAQAEANATEWAGQVAEAERQAKTEADAVEHLEHELATARGLRHEADQRLRTAEGELTRARRAADTARREAVQARALADRSP